MTWNQRYKSAYCEYTKAKAPAFFEQSGGHNMILKYPKVTSSNGLRRAIIDYMKWKGHHLEATNTMGRPIEKFAPKMNIITGKVEQIPNGIQWQKGAGIVGSSDAKGHINIPGRDYAIPLYVEIKWNKDKQSDPQIGYEQLIKNTGGVYVIAKTIDGYFFWFDQFLLSL